LAGSAYGPSLPTATVFSVREGGLNPGKGQASGGKGWLRYDSEKTGRFSFRVPVGKVGGLKIERSPCYDRRFKSKKRSRKSTVQSHPDFMHGVEVGQSKKGREVTPEGDMAKED